MEEVSNISVFQLLQQDFIICETLNEFPKQILENSCIKFPAKQNIMLSMMIFITLQIIPKLNSTFYNIMSIGNCYSNCYTNYFLLLRTVT